jgi:transcriptional regulator with XRE-family HTH domain
MFGSRLKELREQQGMSQRELAKLLQLSPSTIAMYELGQRSPDKETIIKIADLFSVTVDYLLGRPSVVVTQSQHPGAINAGGFERVLASMPEGPEKESLAALVDDVELFIFWKEMMRRDDLLLLFKHSRPLSPEAIKRVIRYIKMVEEEETGQD